MVGMLLLSTSTDMHSKITSFMATCEFKSLEDQASIDLLYCVTLSSLIKGSNFTSVYGPLPPDTKSHSIELVSIL